MGRDNQAAMTKPQNLITSWAKTRSRHIITGQKQNNVNHAHILAEYLQTSNRFAMHGLGWLWIYHPFPPQGVQKFSYSILHHLHQRIVHGLQSKLKGEPYCIEYCNLRPFQTTSCLNSEEFFSWIPRPLFYDNNNNP